MTVHPHTQQLHEEWVRLVTRADELELQLKRALQRDFDVQKGDVCRCPEQDIVIAVTTIGLANTMRNYGWKGAGETPYLILDGVIITKAGRLHARRHTRGFNTTYEFDRVGRVELLNADSDFASAVGRVLEPRDTPVAENADG